MFQARTFDAHMIGASIQQMKRDAAGVQVSLSGVRCDLAD
jgi:hypothetical protein